jgi:hypothetical protein
MNSLEIIKPDLNSETKQEIISKIENLIKDNKVDTRFNGFAYLYSRFGKLVNPDGTLVDKAKEILGDENNNLQNRAKSFVNQGFQGDCTESSAWLVQKVAEIIETYKEEYSFEFDINTSTEVDDNEMIRHTGVVFEIDNQRFILEPAFGFYQAIRIEQGNEIKSKKDNIIKVLQIRNSVFEGNDFFRTETKFSNNPKAFLREYTSKVGGNKEDTIIQDFQRDYNLSSGNRIAYVNVDQKLHKNKTIVTSFNKGSIDIEFPLDNEKRRNIKNLDDQMKLRLDRFSENWYLGQNLQKWLILNRLLIDANIIH